VSEGLARRKALRAFGRSLGLKATATGDCGLLDNALTHDSYAFEHGGSRRGQVSNERLEFLGDAVIGLAASAWLFERHPNEPEGWLSRRRQALVSGAALSQTAARIGVGPLLRLGEQLATLPRIGLLSCLGLRHETQVESAGLLAIAVPRSRRRGETGRKALPCPHQLAGVECALRCRIAGGDTCGRSPRVMPRARRQ
jgi:hypothetical protein